MRRNLQLTRTIKQSVLIEPISFFQKMLPVSIVFYVRISVFFLDKTKVYVDFGRRCKLLGLVHQGLMLAWSVRENQRYEQYLPEDLIP